MIFEPLAVVVVPFPFTDRKAAKRRPALVVSSEAFNENHEQTILAMITSAAGGNWPSDVIVEDWQAAGLNVPCRVRLKLFTLDNDLILRPLGGLSRRDGGAVGAALARFLVGD